MRRWMVIYGEHGEEAEYFNTEAEAADRLKAIIDGMLDNAEDRSPNFGNCAVYFQTHEIHEPTHQDEDPRVEKLP